MMGRFEVLNILRAHEGSLRAAGIHRLALFGSTARGEAGPESDVDIVVRLAERDVGFAYFGQLDRLQHELETLLHKPVDLLVEPIQKERLRKSVERDEVVAFD